MRLTGALPLDTLHVVVDMQRLFIEHPDWCVPELPNLVAPISKIIEAHPRRTVFTRFITPRKPEDAGGQWRHYYRRWESLAFAEAIARRQSTTLVLTGVETDVCVLALAFGATDRGYRVIVVEDAVTSSSPAGHRATLEAIYPRLDQQIQIATVDEVLAAWPAERRAE